MRDASRFHISRMEFATVEISGEKRRELKSRDSMLLVVEWMCSVSPGSFTVAA